MRDIVGLMFKLDELAKDGDGLRPELRSLYERLAKDPHAAQFFRADGMLQSGPDPAHERKPPAKCSTNLFVRPDDAAARSASCAGSMHSLKPG
jgi:hypothetical protein